MKLAYTQKHLMPKGEQFAISVLYLCTIIAATFLPLLIWQLKLSIVQATYDGSTFGTLESEPFELFGFFASIALSTHTWCQIQKQKIKTLKKLVQIILPLLTSLSLLVILVESSYTKSSDYMCYENAAKAIINGLNPYVGNPQCYLYPPLLAQTLAFLHEVVNNKVLFQFSNENEIWLTVFYFYQCSQFLNILSGYYLSYSFARYLGLKQFSASFLISALFLFNDPLFRTIKFEQINLWILNSFLLSILLVKRYPLLSGFATSIGAHLKLYTFILLLPWTYTKRWLAILGVLVSFFITVLLETNFGQDWTLWQQFLIYFKNPEKPSNYRNNSLWSLTFNLFKIPADLFHTDALFKLVPLVVTALSLVIIGYFIFRLVKRERIYLESIRTSNLSTGKVCHDSFRLYGHTIDAIALSLLISPSVWEHHYVIAIPIAIWAIIVSRFERPQFAAIGTFLIFCLPTFEVFPLSFHRLLGLLLLVYGTTPESAQNYLLTRQYKS